MKTTPQVLVLVALIAAAAGLGLGWWLSGGMQPDDIGEQRRAYVQYVINTSPQGFLEPITLGPREADRLRATQAAYVKSPLVLQGALGADLSKLTKLEVFEGMNGDQQMEWLKEHVVAWYPADGDLLEIAVVHPTADRKELLDLVRGVGRAYYEMVVFEHSRERALPLQMLQKSHKQVEQKLDSTLIEQAMLTQALEPSADDEEADEPNEAEAYRVRLALQREVDRLRRLGDELWFEIERLRVNNQAPSRFLPIGATRRGSPAADFYGEP
ncbi:hypothetical protein MalM25_17980 [Planctomycetes bacterium MalM25]|nr:hypothetical protein MalM25_17980 [Planctomycetes bacterium MalM25]